MFEPLIRQVQNTETVSRTGKVENIVGMSIEASGGRAAVGVLRAVGEADADACSVSGSLPRLL